MRSKQKLREKLEEHIKNCEELRKVCDPLEKSVCGNMAEVEEADKVVERMRQILKGA